MSIFSDLLRMCVVLLVAVFGANTAFSVQVFPIEVIYYQTETTHISQINDVGFAARAPPLVGADVAITGDVTVMQGSAFALHGQETVAALFGFGRDLVAPNNGVLPSGSGNYTPAHLPGFGSQVDPRFPDRVSGPTQGVVDTPVGPVYLQSGVNGPASGYNNPNLPAVNQASSHVAGARYATDWFYTKCSMDGC